MNIASLVRLSQHILCECSQSECCLSRQTLSVNIYYVSVVVNNASLGRLSVNIYNMTVVKVNVASLSRLCQSTYIALMTAAHPSFPRASNRSQCLVTITFASICLLNFPLGYPFVFIGRV